MAPHSFRRHFFSKTTVFLFVLVTLYACIHMNIVTVTLRLPQVPSFDVLERLGFMGPGLAGAIRYYAKDVWWNSGESMRFIILAMADASFSDMALNLYLTSFRRFNINNFLFVGGGRNACDRLNRLRIQCFDFKNDSSSNVSSLFGSRDFIRKMNIRTEMILVALGTGVSVLHTDNDVVFLRNPMPEIESLLENNSMAILWDYLLYNAGFLAIKATPFSVDVYTRMQRKTNASGAVDDQKALNDALNEIRRIHSANKSYRPPITLDPKRFLCGRSYYIPSRYFPAANLSDNCPECLVVHNNWIVSKEAKVLRFKETAMWHVDEDGYYSDEERRYLFYYNPWLREPPKGYDVRSTEIRALRAGLKMAFALNRTLILPRFNCHKDFKCPLNSWFTVRYFDKQFAPNYRESSFLLSSLVPESISMKPRKECPPSDSHASLYPRETSTSTTTRMCNKRRSDPKSRCVPFDPAPILIVTNRTERLLNWTMAALPDSEILDLRDYDRLNESLVLESFGRCADQVLVLASLLDVEIRLSDPKEERSFEARLDASFVGGVYAQIRF